MRNAMIAVGAALIVSGSAMAQAPASPAPPAQSAPSEETGTRIKSISVVDMDALPAAAQEQVKKQSAAQPAGQLQQIQTTIENEPKLKSALAVKGFTSRDVVMAALDSEGELTIVAKRAA